jgi:hypothetical protein
MNYVLASYGDGTTYWAQPSTLGALPTWNEFLFDSNRYRGSVSSASLQISGTNGIFLSTLTSSIQSSLQVFNTDFLFVDISGAESLFAYSNFLLDNTLRIGTTGFLSSSTIPSQTKIIVGSLREAPALSTNGISFQAIKVISSLESNINTDTILGTTFSKVDPSTFVTLAGIQDFQFQTNFTPAVIALGLSSYSANDFLGLSSLMATSYDSTISSISSLYTQKDIFSTAMISISTTESLLLSTNVSTVVELSNYTQLRYDQKFGDTMARATIIQLNDQFGVLNTGMSTISSVKTPVYIMESTTKGFIDQYSSAVTLSTSTFADFGAGSIFEFQVDALYVISTQLSTFSTTVGTSITEYVNSINQSLQNYTVSTNSTFVNLGTIGFISSLSLSSTIKELGTLGYVSTSGVTSTVSNLQKTYYTESSFLSTIQSTTRGLFDHSPIISSLTLTSTLVSTTKGIQNQAALTYISSAGLKDSIVSTTSGSIAYAGENGYISTPTLISTFISSFGFGISSFYTLKDTLLSTITSTTNSVISTNSLIFVSVPSLIGYASTLSNEQYIVREQLQSTVSGLLDKQDRLFTSSLVIPQEFSGVEVPMTLAFIGFNGYTYFEANQYFSSVQYEKLEGFSKRFDTAQFVTIEYTPSIFFSEFSISYSNFASNYVSTLIQIGDTYYADTLFKERTYLTVYGSNGSAPSNVYSRKIIMQMRKEDFLEAETKGFAISHVFQNMYVGGQPTVSDQCSLFTPRSNSLFISIYN